MQTVFTFDLDSANTSYVSSYIRVDLSDLTPATKETIKVDWTLFKNATVADYFIGDSIWKI